MSKKDEDKKALNVVGNVLLAIIRIMVFVFILIPLYLILVSVLGATIFYIVLLIDGLPYLTPLFGLLALTAFLLFFTYLFTKLVINGDVKIGVLLFHFTACLTLLVTTSILCPFEVLRTKVVDGLPESYKMVKTETKISNKKVLNTNNYFVKYVVDKKAKNNYRVVINEPDYDYEEFKIVNDDSGVKLIKVEKENYEDFKELVNIVYDNLKQKKVYQYNRLYDKEITIYANQKTIDKIKKANQHQ